MGGTADGCLQGEAGCTGAHVTSAHPALPVQAKAEAWFNCMGAKGGSTGDADSPRGSPAMKVPVLKAPNLPPPPGRPRQVSDHKAPQHSLQQFKVQSGRGALANLHCRPRHGANGAGPKADVPAARPGCSTGALQANVCCCNKVCCAAGFSSQLSFSPGGCCGKLQRS